MLIVPEEILSRSADVDPKGRTPFLTSGWILTFGAGLDGAGGPDLVAVLPPLAAHLLQGHFAHEDRVLVLYHTQVLQLLDDLHSMF